MTEPAGEIVLFQGDDGTPRIQVRLDEQTVWLSLNQMAELFQRDKSTVSRHIANVFGEGELQQKRCVADFATHLPDGRTYQVAHYNLDVIISVGYRVKSLRGTQFRIWATERLREYLVKGFAMDDDRLKQLCGGTYWRELLEILQRSDYKVVSGIAELLARFTHGLDLLDRYDHQSLSAPTGRPSGWVFSYDEARTVIEAMSFGSASDLFGRERDGSFAGVIAGLYQTFGGIELYPTAQEKAAHLLYLVVKDHCFTDGNKRIAAALFVYFLDRCGLLFGVDGRPRVGNSALAAITVMIAVSRPEEKDDMILLVRNMLQIGDS